MRNAILETKIINTGERRLGIDRRQFSYTDYVPERRSSKERRKGFDRRSGFDRRNKNGMEHR